MNSHRPAHDHSPAATDHAESVPALRPAIQENAGDRFSLAQENAAAQPQRLLNPELIYPAGSEMMSSVDRFAFKLIFRLAGVFCVDSAGAPNMVEHTTAEFTANPVRLTDTDVSEFILRTPDFETRSALPDAKRAFTKHEGAAFVGQMVTHRLLTVIDARGCESDFSFIEKFVYTLWASEGGTALNSNCEAQPQDF